MECAEAPNEIDSVNPNHRPPWKRLGDSVERHAIVGIVKSRYEYGAVGDVEIRIARGKSLAVHHDGAGEWNHDYPEWILF